MTEAVFLTLGRSRSSLLKKIGLRPKAKAEAEGTKFPPAALIVNSTSLSEVECIKYDILDFCNHLLVTANFSFENNMVLL